MGAFVKHKFKKGFCLDEERIRKINDIIIKRIKEIDDTLKPIYNIHRGDGFSYNTSDIQDIINEENLESSLVTRIDVSFKKNKEIEFQLDFTKNENYIFIEGEDRDFVHLLFSDLKNYLSIEVNTIRKFSNKTRSLFMLTPFFFMIYTLYLFSREKQDLPQIQGVLDSQDINIKLNYLIQTQSNESINSFYGAFIAFFIISFLIIFGEEKFIEFYRYLYPCNIFLFGKEIEKYKNIEKLRDKLVFGIVTLLIGIIAGYVVLQIT
ncbi:hypothetical protein KKA03_05375 [archaeon]|nr:hypothetical protein [archaeon]